MVFVANTARAGPIPQIKKTFYQILVYSVLSSGWFWLAVASAECSWGWLSLRFSGSIWSAWPWRLLRRWFWVGSVIRSFHCEYGSHAGKSPLHNIQDAKRQIGSGIDTQHFIFCPPYLRTFFNVSLPSFQRTNSSCPNSNSWFVRLLCVVWM